jgi:hypothetical protein
MAKDGNLYDAQKHLKGLEWLVGEWTSQGEFEGSMLVVEVTTRWLHNNSFLRSNWTISHAGKNVFEREITWYWDPVWKVVRNHKFDSDGEWGRATIEVGEGTLRGRREYVDRVGTATSSVFVMKRTGADSYTFAEEGALHLTFRRKK